MNSLSAPLCVPTQSFLLPWQHGSGRLSLRKPSAGAPVQTFLRLGRNDRETGAAAYGLRGRRASFLPPRAEAGDRGGWQGSAENLASLEEGEPWLGAVVYHRSGARNQFVVTTTLERLGLPHLSSEASRAEAAETLLADVAQESGGEKGVQGEGRTEGDEVLEGTAVVVRYETRREGRDVVVEGTVDTVFAMQCNRCLCPVTEPISSEFTLLLSALPVLEPTKRSLGIILDRPDTWQHAEGPFGADVDSGAASFNDGDEMLDLDLDDKIFFPPDQKSVDLSKHIRDTVHLEIPLKVRCGPTCKGMCLDCGANLNVSKCTCPDVPGAAAGGGKGSASKAGKSPTSGGIVLPGSNRGGGPKGSLREQLERLYQVDGPSEDGNEFEK